MDRRSLMLSTLHRIQNPTLRAVWMIRALRGNGGSSGGEATNDAAKLGTAKLGVLKLGKE